MRYAWIKIGRDADGLPMTLREITLADAGPFSVGGLSVMPSLRMVRDARGGETTIEPRVMQCLVALVQRNGSVVSRDELLRTCWGGATVSDDAVNRCISRLRALGTATGAFAIDTIARVGFRLTPSGHSDATGLPDRDACVLAVLPFGDLSPDQGLSSFATDIAGEIVHRLSSAQGVRLIEQERGASHVLTGYLRRDGERAGAMFRLVERATETVLWSERYDVDLADPVGAVDEVAAGATHAIRCRLDAAVRSGSVDSIAYDLFLRTRRRPDRLGIQALKANIAALEDVVARAPAFAEAWGALAHSRALLASFAPVEEGAALRSAAKENAMHALSLNERCAAAAVALAVANPGHENIRGHISWLRHAVTWQPDDANAVRLYSRALAAVGRNAEALVQARRAERLDPLDPNIAAMMGRTLCENGAYAEAEAVLQRARRRWPAFELIAVWLCVTRIAAGDRAGAAELAAASDLGLYRGDIEELLTDQSGSQALATLRHAQQKGTCVTVTSVVRAAEGGHVEEALRIALACGLGGGAGALSSRGLSANNLAVLFSAWQPAIRQHRLFVTLCDRLGLVAHWRETGSWPDCASDGSLSYDLREVAR